MLISNRIKYVLGVLVIICLQQTCLQVMSLDLPDTEDSIDNLYFQDCPKVENCYCYSMFNIYVMTCSSRNFTVEITVDKKQSIVIRCDTEVADNFYLALPVFEMSQVVSLEIKNCPIPDHESLAKMEEMLYANSIQDFRYEVDQQVNSKAPTRQLFRVFNTLKDLTIIDNSQQNLPADLFAELPNLTRLELKTACKTLPTDIFQNLANLKLLDLGMQLEEVGGGLNNLQGLTLIDNSEQYLPADLLANLSKLVALKLTTACKTLPTEIFQKLTSLEYLELDMQLEEVGVGLLANLKNLQRLQIRSKRLRRLSNGSLTGLAKLRTLNLSSNNIQELASQVFGELFNLEILALHSNQLSSLPEKLFERNSNLNQVYLVDNGHAIEELPNGLFANLPRLELLEIKAGVKRLPENLIQGSHELGYLTLRENQFQSIPAQLLHSQVRLVKLDLRSNNLSKLPDEVFACTWDLEILDLSHNKLENVTADIFTPKYSTLTRCSWPLGTNQLKNDSKLRELDLSYNSISEIALKNLHFSQAHLTVKLTNNKITHIDTEDAMPKELTFDKDRKSPRIHLGYNPFNCDCKALPFWNFAKNPQNKHFLDLEVDELRCNEPEHLQGLKLIDLDSFDFTCSVDPTETSCPGGCTCRRRPVDLAIIINCENAALSEVPKLPTGFNHTEINLSFNNIKQLPLAAVNPEYNQISKLNLANNSLSRLEPENIPENIKELILSNNQFTLLSTDLLGYFHRSELPEKLSLGGNPWLCDCTTVNLLAFINTNPTKIKDVDQILCPKGEILTRYSHFDICLVEQPDMLLIVSLCAGVFVIFLAICSFLTLKYSYFIRLWLRARCWCLINDNSLDEDKLYDAFISFSDIDLTKVLELVSNLEVGPCPYRLCIHVRDWTPGSLISEQYKNSIAESRKTIILLSKHYLESTWGQAEFRQANEVSQKEGRSRVILLFCNDVDPNDSLPDEYKEYIITKTYLKWDDRFFQNKLRKALGDPLSARELRRNRKQQQNSQQTNDVIDDAQDAGDPNTGDIEMRAIR